MRAGKTTNHDLGINVQAKPRSREPKHYELLYS
jgi:hypothetical protein